MVANDGDDCGDSRDVDARYRKRLDAILNTTADGIVTIDVSGTIETFNQACERIFGYRAEEVIGKNVKVLMPDSYALEHDGYIRNYLNTGEKKVIGIGREVEAQRKDGSVFPIDLSVGTYEFAGQRYFSGIIRDISARKKAEEQLLRSNIELERFAYIASHDLQEPLRMVANFTDLLAEEYSDRLDETALEYMGFLKDAARRMQVLVTDLLEYSRAGNDNLELQPVDAADKLRIVLLDMQDVITQTEAKVTYDDLPVLYANPMHFVRLIQNLIGNALKYSRDDVTPEIHIGVEDKQDMWVFSVRDNGIGIAEEYLEQVFVIFKRLHKRSEYEGTGIGLSICKRIVEALNGSIWVESPPGGGSTFYFTIPKFRTVEGKETGNG